MRHLTRHAGRITLLALLATLVPVMAYAGGPLSVCRPGVPYLWANGGADIPWHPDQGPLGPLSNAQGVALVEEAFAQWDAVPTATTTYLQGEALPVNVTIANFLPFYLAPAPDGLSAIVFDDTGAIFDLLFGVGSGVLGFAGPEWVDPSTCTIVEGFAFLNGGAIEDATDTASALDIMVHEFGHYQNLAHTVVNGQILIGDSTGPSPVDTFPFSDLVAVISEAIETMYPFYFGPIAGTATPHKDDIASLSALYPTSDFFASTGTITGRIVAANRRTPKSGINVIARNIADPFIDAVSAISGDYTDEFKPGEPLVGVYTLRGLTPGAEYAVYIDELLAGGFSTPPGVMGGPEESYSGKDETNDATADPPTDLTPVKANAGVVRSRINIVFNGFAENEALPVGDDSAVELALPFTFFMCGTPYDLVIVNANGTISFGQPNRDFSESEAEFLAGPPQIAGAWDDLNPLAGGSVYFTETPWQFTITFDAIPEWTGPTSGTGANTFSITLKRFLSQADVAYGVMSLQDAIAGVSCGGAITSGFEEPTDLSDKADNFRISLLFQPAVYERFTLESPMDLGNLTLRFTPTTPYSDFWAERNDTLRNARRISLPFDSTPVARFTEIGRKGDVDFYRFRARAGQVITAEILSSQLDTVLGFFDRRTGEMLAFDDDSGPGVLSRIVLPIAEDGEYAVAVSTFPDVEFTGDGNGTGRYVLRITAATPTTDASAGPP